MKAILRTADQQVLLFLLCIGLLCLLPPAFSRNQREFGEQAAREPIVFSVDLNASGETELQLLPGIGQTLAGRIVRHRELEGPFQKPADVIKIKGIGPKKTAKILPYIRPIPEAQTAATVP